MIDGLFGSETDNARIQGIWRAVIVQAIQDMSTKSTKRGRLLEADRARAWIETRNFETVCDLADFCPHFIRRKIKECEARGFKWRLPAGKGWRVQQRLMREIRDAEAYAGKTGRPGYVEPQDREFA